MDKITKIDLKKMLWWASVYATPLILVCIAFHAAYYPGQMSPDSVDQFQQFTTWNINDSHPITTTVVYGIIYKLFPSIAFVIFTMYLLFCFSSGLVMAAIAAATNRPICVFLISIVFAVYMPNALVVTTLWKDVPYAVGLNLLTTFLVIYVLRRKESNLYLLSVLLLGVLITLTARHNGVIVSTLLLLVLIVVGSGRERYQFIIVFMISLCIFVASKTLFLSSFNAKRMDIAYNSILALPLLGAMVSSNTIPDAKTKDILISVMPLSSWDENYDCKTVVPLFWNQRLDREILRTKTRDLNVAAVYWAMAHPLLFARHQACMTSILWNPFPRGGEWIAISPGEITPYSTSRELGLSTESLWPSFRETLKYYSSFWAKSHVFNRPATYMYVASFMLLILSVRKGYSWLLVGLPLLLNPISLFPVIGAQDFRYMWPTASLSILVFGLALLLNLHPFGKNRFFTSASL